SSLSPCIFCGGKKERGRYGEEEEKLDMSNCVPDTRRSIMLFDPEGPFIQQWNKAFLICSVVALSLDPLFLYIPIVDGTQNCLDVDHNLANVLCVLRSFADILYVFHIFINFRTMILVPASSRVIGRSKYIDKPQRVAKRYLMSYFIIDVLAALPLPQFGVLIIRLNMVGPNSFTKETLIKYIIFYQYVPRVIQASLFYRKVTKDSVFFIEKAWAGAAFNFFLYVLASHVIGALWYFFAIESELRCWHIACKRQTCNSNSLGQGLKASTFHAEILFADFIGAIGLVLLALLIGNMQACSNLSLRMEEMKEKRLEAEDLMSHFSLPKPLREQVRRHNEYKWEKTRGFELDPFLNDLPTNLRTEIRRHLCLPSLKRVPLFNAMDEHLLYAMCDRLKAVIYTEGSYLLREGDPAHEMLFITHGRLVCGRNGFFNEGILTAGDFCGKELLTWARDPKSQQRPFSTRTVKALTDVQGFTLVVDDLLFITSQFGQHDFRYYSKQWRTWAACFIQAAWWKHCKRNAQERAPHLN
ncbi:hypothetical protein M8C21_030485, partial [Ambrosia artemisiifolia]